MALASAVAAVDGVTAGKRATLKGFIGASALAESQDIKLWEVCSALADGASRDGDKLLYRTLSVIAKYVTPWGILVLLGFGLFQAIQTAKATATGFMGLMKKALSFLGPLKEIGTFVSGLFHDKHMDDDPGASLEAIKMILSANVPLFGVVLSTFEQNVTPVKKDARSITNQLNGGGYDKYQMGTIAYDGELDIAYDYDGNEVDQDQLQPGDVIYDGNRRALKVDADGDLVPV
jgi:hypothetical protein